MHWFANGPGDEYSCAIAPINDDRIYYNVLNSYLLNSNDRNYKNLKDMTPSNSIAKIYSGPIVLDPNNSKLLYAVGLETIHSQLDLFRTGLNVFVSADKTGPWLYVFLAFINPFQIWYVLLLILGIRTVTGMSRQSSVSVALIIWLLTVSFMVILAGFGAMAMNKAAM